MCATSTPPEDIMTPMATPSPAPTTSPYATQAGHGQPGYLGYQYPPPPDPNQALGSGNFTYNLYDCRVNNYNSYNHTSSSDPFASSSTLLAAPPANRDRPQPRRPILRSPAASRADEASRSAFYAGEGLSRLRPQSSIDPTLRAAAQDHSPAPATPAADDANAMKEDDMDETMEEGIPEFDPMSFLEFDGLESGFWRA